ncbi:SPOR domain-containing protein [Novosphingobium lindaniclasticum]|uniref:SPOR domain-containing protein n=1 Tax=Novosphingobium lindaniclasticum LE124 TaxID=1096930 RepID=T0HT98_9SPHN|nr:SPOR domain-containing protein [Novosphingobium lindaniclasticum]EQB19611.1 hypothetical protein L284_00835 [Novosphingobium lindaniclasticum LE124]
MKRLSKLTEIAPTVCAVVAAGLIASCAGRMPLSRADAAAPSDSADRTDLARAEQRVARSPRDASSRAALAQAYLSAGRFGSAATTFEDAIALGDRSPRTALGASLAYIGAGRQPEALAVLQRLHDRVPASDYGLAVALAGQTALGVEVLTNAIRGGENTAKARQNLAYAYALDGRWREARLIASQDVPGDQLDARLGEWARAVRPDQSQARVAGLIGAPLRSDPGQPAMLALAGPAATSRMAAADVPPTTAMAEAELPPVQTGESFWGANEQSAETPTPSPAAVRVVQPLRAAAVSTIRTVAYPKPQPARPKAALSATHLVQLGSFRTMDGAKRAWSAIQSRTPILRGHELRIAQASVNGQTYYRVTTDGFDQRSAQSLCSSLRQSGNACLAYARQRQLPGAVNAGQMRRAEL